MTSQRVPYEDAATPTEMQSDCAAAEQELQLPQPRPQPVTYKAHPATPPVQAPVVTDDMAARAARMELHLG